MSCTAEDTTIITSMPISTNISRLFASLLLTVAVLGGAACDIQVIEGAVETQQGERLPGVVVTVEGTRFQAMTTAQGVYKVRHDGPPVVMRYYKTGYAPAIQEIEPPQSNRVEVPTVQMWRLPVSHGVWLYDNFVYTRARPVEPEPVTLADGRPAFGVKRPSEVDTKADIPFIVIFGRLPGYNISLSKLDMVEAPIPELEGQTEIVWVPVKDIPVSPRPLDEPEGRLIHVRLFEPLEPGSYAVHWGALREPSPIETRAYLLNVVGEATAEAPVAEETDEAESEVQTEDLPPDADAEDPAE